MLKKLVKIIVVLVVIGSAYFAYKANNPADLPAFPECPDSPNCVSSLVEKGSERYIEPLEIKTQPGKPIDLAVYKKVLLTPSRSKLVSESNGVVVISYESRIFGFEDRLALQFNQGGIVHVRSASRVGHYDFGVNRERVENLRQSFADVD